MIKRSLTVLLLLSIPALAEPPTSPPAETPRLDGKFGLDVFRPKQKCAKVAGTLLGKLTKDYRCAPPGNHTTQSGVVLVAVCTASKGRGEYLLFNAAADCERERELILANAAD
jgi:hypothetical protein